MDQVQPSAPSWPSLFMSQMLPVTGNVVTTTALERLVRWWRRDGGGVCALVGIGGCGKTTLLDGFMRRVGVLAGPAGVSTGVPAPASAFVASLALGSVDTVLHDLQRWAEQLSPAGADLINSLMQAGRLGNAPLLIVLDGLEHDQTQGGSEGSGRIRDPRLRDLLTRCAYGAMSGVRIVLTTRLPPTDIEVQRLPLYDKIEMDALDDKAVVALLRSLGARGSDRELRQIGDHYGRHALTIDLAARLDKDLSGTGATLPFAEDVLGSYLEPLRADHNLVELVSLFRRGVPLHLLHVVAARLHLVSDDAIDPALDRLVERRLLARSQVPGADMRLVMHEVLRARIEREIETSTLQRWHAAIANVAVDELKDHLDTLIHEPDRRYEQYEICLAHGAAGEDPIWAAELYWDSIGNFTSAGHRDSRFSWGDSVCRILNHDKPVDDVADYLRADSRGVASAIFSDWGLYLMYLGELDRASRAFERSFGTATSDAQRTIAARNVADSYLLQGRLPQALSWADSARSIALRILRSQEGMPTYESMRGLTEGCETAIAAALRSEGSETANNLLDELAAIHAGAAEAIHSWNRTMVVPLPEPPTFARETFAHGEPLTRILLASGRHEQAIEICHLNLEREMARPSESITSARIRLALATALLSATEVDAAMAQLRAVEAWAKPNEAYVALAEVQLLAARGARMDGELATATEAAAEGLRLSREMGAGLLHVELLAEWARISLESGQPQEAVHAAATALFGQGPLADGEALYEAPARDERRADGDPAWYSASGIFPPAESGRPRLLAATHPDSRNRSGELSCRELLAEGLLAGLAQELHAAELVGAQTTPAGRVIGYASRLLEQAADLADELLGDPSEGTRLRRRLSTLQAGTITVYPASLAPTPLRQTPRAMRRRILISYSRTDSSIVDALADALEGTVDDVFVDRRRIEIGESFVTAINSALRAVTDFVVVISPASVGSLWVQNEVNAAVALRNAGAPIVIRPIVLDGATVPPLLADLNVLQANSESPGGVIRPMVATLSMPL